MWDSITAGTSLHLPRSLTAAITKQNLKIHAFVGNSKNAVLTQIWVALCTYLVLSYLRFLSKSGWSQQRVLRVLQTNLFSKLDLFTLIRPSPPQEGGSPPQMRLWA